MRAKPDSMPDAATTQPAQPAPPPRPWRAWTPVIALTCVAAALRLIGLGRMGLWFDEIHTLTESAFPNVWSAPHQLFFRLDHLFQGLSSDPTVAVRIFPALCGVASIPVLYAWVARLASKQAAMIAAALLCFQPFHLLQSQEGRFYAPMILFSAAALWGLTFWMTTPDRSRWWGALAAAAAAIVSPLNHPSAAPFAMALALASALWAFGTREGRAALAGLIPSRWDKPATRRAAAAAALLILFTAMLILRAPISRALQMMIKNDWGATPGVDFTFGFFASHLAEFGWDFRMFPGLGALAGIANAAGFIFGLALTSRRSKPTGLCLLLITLATFLAVFAYASKHDYNPKYVAFLQPIIVAMISVAMAGLIRRLRERFGARAVGPEWIAAGVMLALMTPALGRYYAGAKMPLRSQFEWLNRKAPDPAEVFIYGHTGFPAALYRIDLALRHNLNYFPWRETAGRLEREIMQTRADMGGSIYFAHAWPHDVPDLLMDWLKSDAEPVVQIPSLMGRQNTGILFKIPRRDPPSFALAARPAAWVSGFHPPGRPQVVDDGSGAMRGLELRSNVTLDYPYQIRKGQSYELEADVEGLVFGRYFLMAGPNGQEPILLGGDLAPGAPGTLRGMFQSSVDTDTLEISYASDYAIAGAERGLKLTRVQLRQGESGLPMRGFLPMPKPATLGGSWRDPRGVAADWSFSPKDVFSLESLREEDDRLIVPVGRISKTKPIARIISPVFRVAPGDLVSFRSQARLFEAYGLSLSPAIYLMNAKGGFVGQITMATSGLSQSVNWDPWTQEILEDPWVTFEGALTMPEGVSYCSVAFMAWESAGQRRVENAANEVHIRPFRISILPAASSPMGPAPPLVNAPRNGAH